MSWDNSVRRSELPSNWEQLRRAVLFDEHGDRRPCRRCGGYATDVDHIGDRHDHSPSNLQPLCRRCHRSKTALEGKLARYGMTPKRGQQRFEPHPGWIG